ncbi:accessory factor UbiK family protein [Aliamphritea spongicola]|uniref:accessory factor UbiK family protein n=1 Tax=Aliamphritea spongicola TaxID=707589 RepID=UPI00196BA6DD|nr:accessory factor UbiK family protein [Aliamphritea spongicola]MBN3564926.1 accessory factor UbiK family protein [Aliamphritea spongicola]
MINQAFLQGLSEQLGQLMNKAPGGSANLQSQIQGVLQGAFSKMDLVNREEFDAQSAVLARTREKLEALEQQLADIESRMSKSDT